MNANSVLGPPVEVTDPDDAFAAVDAVDDDDGVVGGFDDEHTVVRDLRVDAFSIGGRWHWAR